MSNLPSHHRRLLKQFLAESKRRQRVYQDENIVQGPFYHYTSATGARGILESDRVWCMDYASMEDARELEHGLEMARRRLQAVRTGDNAIRDVFMQVLRNTLDRFPRERVGYFVSSFCPEPDDYFLWHRYGEEGAGCSLGFSHAHFAVTPETGDIMRDIRLIRVHYDDAELDSRLTSPVA